MSSEPAATPGDDDPAPLLRAAAAADGLTLRGDAMSLAELDGQLSAWRHDGVERPWLADEVAAYVAQVLADDVPGATVADGGTVRLADRSVVDVPAIVAERLQRDGSTDLRGVVREVHARPVRRRWWQRRRR